MVLFYERGVNYLLGSHAARTLRCDGGVMDVALWQLGIFSAIVLASLMFGWRGLAWSVVIAAIWTVVKIFTSWLMVLQFGTIALAAILGAVVSDARDKTSAEIRANY